MMRLLVIEYLNLQLIKESAYSMNSASFKLPRVRLVLVTALASVIALFAFTGSAMAHQNDPCELLVTPLTADNPLGTSHTVTATVTRKGGNEHGNPSYGESCAAGGAGPAGVSEAWDGNITFVITSGPNAGKTETKQVDANGQATFTWIGNIAGTDTVVASLTYNYKDTSPCANNNSVATAENYYVCVDTLSGEAKKNWIPPNPPVTEFVDPSVKMSISKKCVKTTFKLKPTISGSAKVKKSVLYIDGKKVKSSTTGKSFTVNTARYSSGTHRVKLTTVFDNGTVVVRSGKFKLCKARTTARRLDPRFTG